MPQPSAGKVLIIVENLPVPFDRRVWQEATALREAGYEVSVICPTGKKHTQLEETLDGIHIYRHSLPLEASGVLGYLAEYSAALFHEMRLSIKVLRKHGFDVIHACNPPDLIFLVAAFHKLFFGKKGIFHKLLTIFERCTFKLADGSLATNETLKDRAINTGKMPSDKVWVVRSFPDIGRFKRAEPDPTVNRGRRYLAGYVGIMAEQDGVEYLVRAMDHIVNVEGRDDIGCIIIGDGPDYDRLRALSEELKLTDHVEFAGYVSGQPLLEKLSACDIGVIPDPSNVCNDNLSMNKVFEYMALGMPFVQFNLAQARIDAGDAALVVEESTPESLAQGMIDLLADPERREQMAKYATERAQREFHWEIEKHSMLDAYRTVLQSKEASGFAGSVSVSK